MDTTEKNNKCKQRRVNQMQKFSSEGEHKNRYDWVGNIIHRELCKGRDP